MEIEALAASLITFDADRRWSQPSDFYFPNPNYLRLITFDADRRWSPIGFPLLQVAG